MAIEYNWTFGEITVKNNVNGLNDVIVNFSWRCEAKDTDTNITAAESGYTELPDPKPEAFVNISDIKSEHILAWMGSEKRQEVESVCLQYLNNILNSDTKQVTLNLNQ